MHINMHLRCFAMIGIYIVFIKKNAPKCFENRLETQKFIRLVYTPVEMIGKELTPLLGIFINFGVLVIIAQNLLPEMMTQSVYINQSL